MAMERYTRWLMDTSSTFLIHFLKIYTLPPLAAAQRYQIIVLLRETWTMRTREREHRHYRY